MVTLAIIILLALALYVFSCCAILNIVTTLFI